MFQHWQAALSEQTGDLIGNGEATGKAWTFHAVEADEPGDAVDRRAMNCEIDCRGTSRVDLRPDACVTGVQVIIG